MTATTCSICGKVLTDSESVKVGYGPDCAEKRAAALSGIGSSAEEIEALVNDPAAARWVRLVFAALRRKSQRDARQFIQAARRTTLACAA